MQLIILNGLPATGKTTLAKYLTVQTGIPVVAKDTIKEFMFDTLGTGDREWSSRFGAVANEFLYVLAATLLEAGKSVIVENAFEKAFAAERLRSLAVKYDVPVIEFYCRADKDVRRARFIERNESGNRHAGHVDSLNYIMGDEDQLLDKYAPLGIGETHILDTTDPLGIDRDAIVQQIMAVVS